MSSVACKLVYCNGLLQVAQQHGILVDPIYSLAAWEAATHLLQNSHGNCRTVMLHTGGALGLQGVAQCHPDWF